MVLNNFQQKEELWVIVPLLSDQAIEISDFIREHQWFFDEGGSAVFKINGVIRNESLPNISNYNIHFLQIPDMSLYEAWNQAMNYLQQRKICENSYITFLGLDDLWSKEFVIRANKLISEQKNIDFIFGNSRHLFQGRFRNYDTPEHPSLFGENYFVFDIPHPGMLNRWSAVSNYRFDTNFRLAADFDFYIGVALQHKITYKKINCVQAMLGAVGVSNGLKAKKIYLQEWGQIEIKRKIKLNLNLRRAKLVELISRWPYFFQKARKVWWAIKAEKY